MLHKYFILFFILFSFQSFGALQPSTTVDNFPSSYPLPSGQLSTLTPPSSTTVLNFPATQAVTGNFLTNTQLRASPIDVSGTLSINTAGLATSANQVTSNGYLSGLLTDTQLRSTPLVTSATGTAPVSLSSIPLASNAATASNQSTQITELTSIDNLLSTYLSGIATELTLQDVVADLVSVITATSQTATNTTNVLTDTQLRASPIPVSGTFSIMFPAVQGVSQVGVWRSEVSGTPTVLISGIVPTSATGVTSVNFTNASIGATQVGTWLAPSGTTVVSSTGIVPISVLALPLPSGAATSSKQDSQTTLLTSIDSYSQSIENNTSGLLTDFQLRASPLAVSQSSVWRTEVSGTPTVSISGSITTSGTTQITAGNSVIGAISNTSFTATQATGTNLHTVVDSGNITSSGTSQLTASSAVIGHILTDSGSVVSTTGVIPISATSLPIHGVLQSGTWNSPSGTTTVSGTAQLTAGNSIIGSISNSIFGATQIGQWLSPSGTTTVSGTNQLTAGSAIIGSLVANQSVSATAQLVASAAVIGHVINDASSAVIGHVITDTGSVVSTTGIIPVSFSGVVTTSGTSQITAGNAIIGSISNSIFGATQTGQWLSPSGTTTVSGTAQLTASTAIIGSLVANQSVSATAQLVASAAVIGHVINDAGSAIIGHVLVDSGAVSVTNTVTTSGTSQITAGNAVIGSISNSIFGATQTGTWLSPSGTTTVSGTSQLTASSAVIGHIISDSGSVVSTTGIIPVSFSGTTTTSGTTQLTAGTAVIGSMSNTQFGATQVGTWLSPSGTTTVSGTMQLTASTAAIGTVSTTGTVQVLNLAGANAIGGVFQAGTWLSPSGTTTVSGTSQLTAGTAIIGSLVANQTVSGAVQISAGSAVIGALTANQSINHNQVGGAAVAIGNGVSATGVARVAIISDNTPFGVSPTGIVSTWETPQSGSTNGLSNSDSSLVPKVSVKGSAGRLYLLTGYSALSSAQWIQIFDSASQPSANAVPMITIPVQGLGFYSYDAGVFGKVFSSGIYVANSTSGTAYVNGVSNTWFNASYK